MFPVPRMKSEIHPAGKKFHLSFGIMALAEIGGDGKLRRVWTETDSAFYIL
jgi:hypothetical protein